METYESELKKETRQTSYTSLTYVKRAGMAIAFVAGLGMGSGIYNLRNAAKQNPDDISYGNQLMKRGFETMAYNAVACLGLGIMAYADSRLKSRRKQENIDAIIDLDELEEDVMELNESTDLADK